MKIKICGMKFSDNIQEVAALQPDFLGFIFYKKSLRYFDGSIPNISKSIQKVGIFVDENPENVLEIAKKHHLNYLQLHGTETPEYCKKLQENYKIIKAFAIDSTFNFNILKEYEIICDYFLFDTKGTNHGGNGKLFDWSILEKYTSQKPYFLSGGISINEVEAIQNLKTKPFAIDINSKFEIEPALKNKDSISKFIKKLNSKYMYQVSENGFYGNFGGAFIPEMLYPNVEELRQKYLTIIAQKDFQQEFNQLLQNYVGRPTPLYFAKRLSEKYQTKIYLKREDLCHTGAHKINNTIGQILVAKRLGKTRIIAETGAGQHGVATATVCALMGLECIVYMGEVDIKRQAPNVARMKMLGAEVRPAKSGSKTLKDATNEAIRDWINNPTDTYYIIGSVVGPHPYPDMVAKFQSIISQEIKQQLQEIENRENPDYVIACVGGGSNAAGAFYHFLDNPDVKLIAVEAAGHGIDSGESAATSVLGKIGVIHGSKTLLMQSEDGQITEPYSISAGLDYPGVGPLHSHLFETKRAEFVAITDTDAMQAGINLSQTEGIIPAIESAHALAVLNHKKFGKENIVVINLSGRGDKDLDTYIKYFKY
jgi:phosphoribosylanthranilate isomerase